MLLRALALTGGLVLLSAAARPPALDKAFSSTIISTYPDGRTARLWMRPGGAYTSMGRRGDRHSGHWSMRGDKVCFRRGLFGYCTPMPTETAFTTRAITGETIKVRLVPGRQGEQNG